MLLEKYNPLPERCIYKVEIKYNNYKNFFKILKL